jgi:hypothetical protein
LGSGLLRSQVPASSEENLEAKRRVHREGNVNNDKTSNGKIEMEEKRNSQQSPSMTSSNPGNVVKSEPSSLQIEGTRGPMDMKYNVTKSRERRSFSLPTNVAELTNGNSVQSFWSFWKRKHRCLSCVKRTQGASCVPKNLLNVKVVQDDQIVTTQLRKVAQTMDSDLVTSSDILRAGDLNGGVASANEMDASGLNQLPTYSQRGITLFLLDWDDTLFASTFLASCDSVELLSEEERSNLSKLESIVTLFLKALNARGHIAIVTNADAYWVEMTCQRFMPKVYSYLEQFQVLVVSARNLFGSDSRAPVSSCPSDWKAAAFLKLMIYFFSATATEKKEILQLSQPALTSDEETDMVGEVTKEGKPPLYIKYSLSRFCTQRNWTKAIYALDMFHRRKKKKERPPHSSSIILSPMDMDNWKFEKAVLVDKESFACHHIIVMGDACFEHNAVNTLRAQYPQAHFKFIQFISEPTMADLSQQLKSVYGALDEIGNFAGNLDVRLKPQ